jgi:hypothetical protein
MPEIVAQSAETGQRSLRGPRAPRAADDRGDVHARLRRAARAGDCRTLGADPPHSGVPTKRGHERRIPAVSAALSRLVSAQDWIVARTPAHPGFEGTLREHQRGRSRPRAVTSPRSVLPVCEAFVDGVTRACPRFQPSRSMVRRGSAVRVRQRASSFCLLSRCFRCLC